MEGMNGNQSGCIGGSVCHRINPSPLDGVLADASPETSLHTGGADKHNTTLRSRDSFGSTSLYIYNNNKNNNNN